MATAMPSLKEISIDQQWLPLRALTVTERENAWIKNANVEPTINLSTPRVP